MRGLVCRVRFELMRKPGFDPGLTQQFTGNVRRIIEKDGSFNVRRRGGTWHDVHPYLHLINMGWAPFLAWLFLGYLVINTIFALVYFGMGPGELQGAEASTAGGRFLNCFFFSAHTLSTVGYGSISPKGLGANIVASLESLVRRAGLRGGDRPAVRARVAALGQDRLQREHADRAVSGHHEPAIPRGQPARERPDGDRGARAC